MDYERVRQDIERSGLAEATKRHYYSKLRQFEKTSFPTDALRAVEQVNRSGKASSELAYLTFLLGTARISGEMKRALGRQARKLMQRADVLATQSGDERRERRPRATDIKWEDILACGEDIEPQDRLLFSLYTLIPPQRADYAEMRIVDTPGEAEDEEANYYVRKTGEFVFRAYKSAQKYGEKVVKAPPKLRKLIGELPPEQQYVLERDKKPLSTNGLSQRVTRMFKRSCGLHVTINTLRRSWAEHSMRGNPSDERVAELAAALDHSSETHRAYAFMT